jgi:hypothetical protein
MTETANWNRFTARARSTVDRALRNKPTTTVELLSALVDEGENLASTVLAALDVEPSDVVAEARGHGNGIDLRGALDRAVSEAVRLRHTTSGVNTRYWGSPRAGRCRRSSCSPSYGCRSRQAPHGGQRRGRRCGVQPNPAGDGRLVRAGSRHSGGHPVEAYPAGAGDCDVARPGRRAFRRSPNSTPLPESVAAGERFLRGPGGAQADQRFGLGTRSGRTLRCRGCAARCSGSAGGAATEKKVRATRSPSDGSDTDHIASVSVVNAR